MAVVPEEAVVFVNDLGDVPEGGGEDLSSVDGEFEEGVPGFVNGVKREGTGAQDADGRAVGDATTEGGEDSITTGQGNGSTRRSRVGAAFYGRKSGLERADPRRTSRRNLTTRRK